MRVIVATNNVDKMKEFARIFETYGIEVTLQSEACPELVAEETGATFEENAFIKANAVFKLTGKAAVADDSGLCIDALDGAPGVLSARYAGEQTPYPEKIQILLEEMKDVPLGKRDAKFVSHICFINEKGERVDFEEECPGVISTAPRGKNGFGYDPIFIVPGGSFAELSDRKKDEISHRGKALKKLAQHLEGKYR